MCDVNIRRAECVRALYDLVKMESNFVKVQIIYERPYTLGAVRVFIPSYGGTVSAVSIAECDNQDIYQPYIGRDIVIKRLFRQIADMDNLIEPIIRIRDRIVSIRTQFGR